MSSLPVMSKPMVISDAMPALRPLPSDGRRNVGVLLAIACAAFPAAALPLLSLQYLRTQRALACSIAFGVLFGAVALTMEVVATGDLARYIAAAGVYKGEGVASIVSGPYSSYPAAALLMWFAANTTGADTLPFFVAAWVYGVLAYVVLDYFKDREGSHKLELLVLAGCLCAVSFFGIVSAVRSSLALSACMLALYRDIHQGKRGAPTVLMYAIPCLIHAVGFLIVLIRLLFPLFKSKPALGMAISFAAIPVATALLGSLDVTIPVIDVNLTRILNEYSEWSDTGWAAEVAASNLQRALRIANLCLIAALSVACYKARGSHEGVRTGDLATLTLVGLLVTAGFAVFITAPVYLRLAYVFEPLGLMTFAQPLGEPGQHEGDESPLFPLLGYLIAALLAALLALHLFQLNAAVDLESVARGLAFGVFGRFLS